ncbi:MAG: hypothetical protein EOP82_32320 [Variovorax sp.]|nr:MAG: hypothetical protein EOP82_32320 [Variovorax sp.]
MTPLRQRMLEDMGIRNFAENTQLSYLQQVSRYARHFERSPEELGPEQVRTYQVHLTKTCKLAPGSVSIATAALRFLYKVTLKREWMPDDISMRACHCVLVPIVGDGSSPTQRGTRIAHVAARSRFDWDHPGSTRSEVPRVLDSLSLFQSP